MQTRRRANLYFILLAGLLLALALPGWAVDYYINFDTGSNRTGDGSLGNPWKTLSYAVKKTEAGETDDVFHMAAGNYINDQSLSTLDREVFPIKIRPGTHLIGEGSGLTVIDAGYVVETTSRMIEGTPDVDMTGILIQGITFQNNNITNGTDGPGIYLKQAGGAIQNCEFINLKTTGNRGAVWIAGNGVSSFDFEENLIRECRTTGASSTFGGCSISNASGNFVNNQVADCQSTGAGCVLLSSFKGTVTGNHIASGSSSHRGSGGLQIDNMTDGEIAYNAFESNKGQRTDGGQLYLDTVKARVHHNTFTNGQTAYDCRATLGICGGSDVEIDNNSFTYNHQSSAAGNSGAISVSVVSNPVNVHHNTFVGNRGNKSGAIYFNQCKGVITHNTFEQNRNSYHGTIRVQNNCTADITYNEFTGNISEGNSARTAGISYYNISSGDIIGNTFINNSSYKNHSCMNLETYKGNIRGNLFQGNRCVDAENGFTASIVLSGATGEMTSISNNFIVDNYGNGVYLEGGSEDTRFFIHNTLANQNKDQMTIQTNNWNIFNNIFYGGYVSIRENAVLTTNLENNLFFKFKKSFYFDNNVDHYYNIEDFEFFKDEAQRNVMKDPQFVDPAKWDYHLAPTSPAVDGAYDGSLHPPGTFPTTDTDFDLNIRPIDIAGVNNNVYMGGDDYDEYDIGADEFLTGASFSISGKVTDTDGNPIEGVTIDSKDIYSAFTASDITASDGTYSISGLSQSRYRLTPSKTNHTFWPHFREVALSYGDKTDVNFESITEGNPTFLRGTVYDFSGAPVSGASVFMTNQMSLMKPVKLLDASTTVSITTTTNAQGQFNATVPAGSGYGIRLSKEGYQTKRLFQITAPDDLVIYMELTAPMAPTGLVATGGAKTISLKWNPSPEPSVVGYHVYRDTSKSGNFETRINPSLVKNASFLDETVTINTTYWYKVTAVNIAGFESQKSVEASAKAGSIEIFVRDARGPNGGTARIPINLSDATGVSCSGFSIAFTFDNSILTPTSFEKTFLTRNFVIESDLGTGPADTLTFTGNCATPISIPSGSGHIIDIIFSVAGSDDDQSILEFGDVTLKDADENDIIVTKTGANFTVASDFILGDIDGDGDVDGDDAALGQRIAVGLQDPTPLQFNAGEINGDGIIDAADITMVLRIADGLPINPTGDVPAPAPLYTFSLGSATASPGASVQIPVTINPFDHVSGIDFDLLFDASRITPLDVTLEPSIATNYIMEKNLNKAGHARVTLSDKADATVGTSVDLVKVNFEVAITAQNTAIPISWSMADLSRHFGQKVRWEGSVIVTKNGVIYVGAHELLPFERVLNFLLGKESLNTEEYFQADANEDGIVDVSDLVWMVINGHGPGSG